MENVTKSYFLVSFNADIFSVRCIGKLNATGITADG